MKKFQIVRFDDLYNMSDKETMDLQDLRQKQDETTNEIYQEDDERVQCRGPEKDESEYPPLKVISPAMAAIYLALFLVSLVRIIRSR